MVLGARDQQGKGLVLLYESDDLNTWKYKNRITTEVPFGYMWECPDLFELNGEWYLTCCPQGVEQNGLDYANVHQSCWMKIDADFDNNHFEVKEIHQLDRGTDFYAQQSFVDEKGRRIMIGWLGIPDADYTNPTVDHQWQHALTLPRELVVKNGNLCQKPIDEIYQLRGSHKTCSLNENVSWEELQYECDMHFDICNTFKMHLRKGLTLSYKNDVLKLSFDKNGYGRSERAVHCGKLSDLQIFMDTTSVEIFVNGISHIVTDTEHSTECIRTRTQMGYLAKELHRVPFFLQRIRIVASTQHFNFTCLDFSFLTGAYRFRQHTVHAQTSSCGNFFQHLLIEVCQIHHNLHIIYCRTVVQRDKINLLTTSAGTNPTFHVDHSAKILALQQVNNLCSTNLFHKTVIIT